MNSSFVKKSVALAVLAATAPLAAFAQLLPAAGAGQHQRPGQVAERFERLFEPD